MIKPTDYNMIGMRIKELRKERNVSQAQLAEKTGLSVSFIKEIVKRFLKQQNALKMHRIYHDICARFILKGGAVI